MKLLTATAEGQGGRRNDYNWCDEGEIVTFVTVECDGEPVDGNCGCRRAMTGIEGAKSTTTMCVREVPLDHDGLIAKLTEFMDRNGWASLFADAPDELTALIEADAAELERLGEVFAPPGEAPLIVEKRGGNIQVRPSKYLRGRD